MPTKYGILREQHTFNKKHQFWVIQIGKRVFDSFLWLVTYFTEMQVSQTCQPAQGFKMPHFEAY